MSHVVTIRGGFTSMACMKGTAERMGGVLTENALTYRWYGRHVGDYPLPQGFTRHQLGNCHHKISFPDTHYEVGVIEIAKLPLDHPARKLYDENEFILIYDFFDHSLHNKMGEGAKTFKQAYKMETTKQTLKKQYKWVKEKSSVNSDGGICAEFEVG